MKWFNLLAILPVVLGVFLLAQAASNRSAPEKRTEPEKVFRVETITVEETALPRLFEGYGTVVVAREWAAVPQVGGRVVSVHPDLRTGATLPEGAQLFVVETTDQRLEQDRLLAEQKAIQAEVKQTKSRRQELEQSLEVSLETLKLLEREEQRYQRLYQAGATPASTVDARHRDVLTQQRAIEEIEASLATLPGQIEAAQARVGALQASSARQGVEIERSVVRAPFTGRVGEVYLEKGQVVSAGTTLFRLQSRNRLRVEARFPLAQLGNFALEGAFVITQNGLRVEATLGPPREQVDPLSQIVSVQLTVDGSTLPNLLPGSLVRVGLVGEPHRPLPVIPRVALHQRDVFVVEEGRIVRKSVEVAFREGDRLAISHGLSPGEQLVISDPGLAMDGSRVEATAVEQ